MQRKKILTLIIFILFTLILVVPKTYAEEVDITGNFKDENLKNSILELAKKATEDEEKTAIYESDIDKIVAQNGGESLRLSNKGITDLSGIEAFAGKGITWIFLDWNEISDLTPLSSINSLTKISFCNNKVSDLTPLTALVNLENISGINNEINSIDSLKGLPKIKYIGLAENELTNIDAIQNWSELVEADFKNNKIEQLPNMAKLTKLKNLDLSNNKITTIENMPQLLELEKIEIDNNQLTSLTGIQNLTNLKRMSCIKNSISQITELAQLNNLENVNISENQIQEIADLQGKENLEYLYMDNNNITSLDILKQNPNIKKYSMNNQTISVEIKEKIEGEKLLIALPELYYELYNANSFIHKENLVTKVVDIETFNIDEQNKNIELNVSDLQNKDSVQVQVLENENCLLRYNIQFDKTPPTVQGVENDHIYYSQVTPICEDNDIAEVRLFKDDLEIPYNLGQTIIELGDYVLIISDKAGNTTQIEFTLETTDAGYIIERDYIKRIERQTKRKDFDKKLQIDSKYEIKRNGTIVKTNEVLKTGDELILQDTGKTYKIIVIGDINKDGDVSVVDLVKIKNYILKRRTFDELEMQAADANVDGKGPSIADLVRIRRIILSK